MYIAQVLPSILGALFETLPISEGSIIEIFSGITDAETVWKGVNKRDLVGYSLAIRSRPDQWLVKGLDTKVTWEYKA